MGWGATLAWRCLKMPYRHNYSVQGASVGRTLYFGRWLHHEELQ